jgi:alpha-L-fucosidase
MRNLHVSIFAATMLAATVAAAAETKPDRDARMAWFRDAKFGMFIHWGIYSVPAGEWKGKTSYAEWFQLQTKMPCEQYDKYAAEFNPVKFDARQWAKTAKDAGMKYLVITSKHHDGFSMFDTKFSDFNIVRSTPYRRDPIKELAAACRDEGIKFCFYYSIADWHNPDSPAVYSQRGFHGNPKDDADVAKYADYMRNQVHELLTGYGPVSILWFDGGGAFKSPDRAKLLKADEMVKMIHETQPDCLINNRLGAGSDYGTPEQYIPAGGAKEPFEVCMTLNGHWGYNKADHNWKSTSTLLHNLIDIVSKGGNYLLNVGPTSEGLIPDPSIERLKQIGAWLKVNGEAIYGAGPTAFGYELGTPGKPDSRGRAKSEGALGWRCTTKPGKIYIHIFDWPEGKCELKEVKPKVSKAYLLVDREKQLPVTQEADRVTVQLPAQMPDSIATVLCLEHE